MPPKITFVVGRRPSLRLPKRPSRTRTSDSIRSAEPEASPRLRRQQSRIKHFQRRWLNINEDLPPQFSRRHIGMISIGGVIGTGLFLGSADALYEGGPLGALLAYFAIGTVVYCLCVSLGEMVSFLPNVGGTVGIADLYVDPALGFALGWTSWYSWTMTFPAEIAAAVVVLNFWEASHRIPVLGLLAIFVSLAIALNCLPSRYYGELEFWLSTLKVITIIVLLVMSLALDLGAGPDGFIGFKNWSQPFAESYLGMTGGKGRFLGFWAVMMQAFFSFSGSEIAGIAAGEVVDARINIPRALKNVWVRITFFYLGGIFVAGLLVPQSNKGLRLDNGTAASSPFVIAFKLAGMKVVPHIVNTVVLIAAWSAAAADLYISSRFLFFVAKCGHAPAFLATLVKYPSYPPSAERASLLESGEVVPFPTIELRTLGKADAVAWPSPIFGSVSSIAEGPEYIERTDVQAETIPERKPFFILPLAAVLCSASFGLLSFLSHTQGSSAQLVFKELCSATSAGSLLTWTATLFTYLRWYQGSKYAEENWRPSADSDPHAKRIVDSIERIKTQRHWGQPYCAIYGLCMCVLIILTNGWSIFMSYEWHIAKPISLGTNQASAVGPVPRFLASYVPIPCFIFLALGYKLVYQTKMVTLDEMCFAPDGVPDVDDLKEPPKKGWRRIVGWIFLY